MNPTYPSDGEDEVAWIGAKTELQVGELCRFFFILRRFKIDKTRDKLSELSRFNAS